MLISFGVQGFLLPICEPLGLLNKEQDEGKVRNEDQTTHCVVQSYHTHAADEQREYDAEDEEYHVLAKPNDPQSRILGDLNRVEANNGQAEAILNK